MANRITIGPPGSKLDWDNWGKPVTDAINDHENRIGVVETQQSAVQVAYTTNGTMASTAGSTEVAMTAWTGGASPTFVFSAGYVYEMSVQAGGSNFATQGAAGRVTVRVRKGVNTIVGQQLMLMYLGVIGNQLITNAGVTRYIKNATAADILTVVGMTVQQSGGSGAGVSGAILYGDADIPLMVAIRKMGSIVSLPTFAAIATAIV